MESLSLARANRGTIAFLLDENSHANALLSIEPTDYIHLITRSPYQFQLAALLVFFINKHTDWGKLPVQSSVRTLWYTVLHLGKAQNYRILPTNFSQKFHSDPKRFSLPEWLTPHQISVCPRSCFRRHRQNQKHHCVN